MIWVKKFAGGLLVAQAFRLRQGSGGPPQLWPVRAWAWDRRPPLKHELI
jgi:hypothetical protein